MSFSIRAETDAGVVEPEGRYTFEMIVRDDRGRPAAGQTLNLSLGPNRAVTLVDGVGTTDEEGRAPITLEAGDVAEAVSLTVTVGEARWQGTLCVTDVHLLARGIDLTRVDEALLLMLFRDKDELRILREFGGGLSGSRVLQVQAFDAAGAFLTQVVKLGIRDEIRHEGANYDLFRDRLSNAAPVAGSVEAGSRAAIIYGDAHAARSLEPVMSLARYFDEHDADDLHAALYAVLEVGLRKVYCRYHVEARTYGQLLGTFLPENVVVGLDGGIGPFGVYRPGHTPALPEGTLRLRPLDVERGAARRSDL